MTIQEAFEALKTIDPTVTRVSENQVFPPYEHTASFDYYANRYPDGKSTWSTEGWEDLIKQVKVDVLRKEIAK